MAEWDARRRTLKVWDSTQAPLPIKNGLAGLFGLPEFSVDVVAPDVGGGFGTKIMLFYPEEILVPHAAITLGRPVKWTEDRREHLIAANQERGQIHDVEVGFDDAGRILGAARSLRPRHRRLHAVRHRRPDHHLDAAPRALSPAELHRRVRGRLHQQGGGVAVSRRRPPARRLRHGAHDRPDRARARARAGGGAAPQLRPAPRVPVGRRAHLPGRRADALRQRRLSGRARDGARDDRRRGFPPATGRGAARRALSRARSRLLRRGHRASARTRAPTCASSRAARSSSRPA